MINNINQKEEKNFQYSMERLQKGLRHDPTTLDNRMFKIVHNLQGSCEFHHESNGKL